VPDYKGLRVQRYAPFGAGSFLCHWLVLRQFRIKFRTLEFTWSIIWSCRLATRCPKSTLSDDGDPLDVLVLVDAPSFPGCVMQVRPIGLMEMLDQGVLDEKVLAVGKNNPRYTDVWNYSEIYPHMLKEITHFFSIYKDLEGKRVEVHGWHDAAYARDRVAWSANNFKENKAAKKSVAG
jgi:hypothetical protein